MTAESRTNARAWSPFRTIAFLGLALALTAAVYLPSLHGIFVFDDYPNIVDNPPVHLTSLDWNSLRDAALASPAKDLVRPLAMLSFALDWYLGSGSAHEMRVVNLLIHLANGILLFLLVRTIARISVRQPTTHRALANRPDILALCVSAAWLLAPINFTAVGYIVQRMESLCQIFVLAGLWCYLQARERMLSRNATVVLPFLALVAGSGLGLLAKEQALLLPLYAFIVEWCLFGFRRSGGNTDKRIVAGFAVVLVLPAVAAACWVLVHYLPSAMWANRTFTLSERLLTEPRIIVDYAKWTLLPQPNWLALYHDDIALSHGLLDPPTTIASIFCLLAAAVLAFLQRISRPLIAIGIFWFLSAQLLTGTVIPLELAFEHRNYFASAGIYLAVFSCLIPSIPGDFRLARASACVALLTLFATVTWIRAMDWGSPISFAMSEAAKNPASPRTAYELGRTYVILSRYQPDSPLIPLAYTTLEHAAAMSGADALPDQALLILSGNLKRPIAPETWQRLQTKLARQPLSAQNISALYSLTQCSIKQVCNFPPPEVIACFNAALSHEPSSATILSVYANYAVNVLRDVPLALELSRSAVSLAPAELQFRMNLLLLLEESGRRNEAIEFYHETSRDLPKAMDDPTYRAWQELLDSPPATVPSQPAPAGHD